MAILPRPYPDEVVGSIFARACAQTGLPSKRLFLRVFGDTRSCTSFLMAADVRRLAVLTGVGPEELVRNHTVFPYAVAFMPQAVQKRLFAKVLSLNVGESSVSSLTKNVSAGVPFKRVCVRCIKDDLHRYGESYWRRSHLLPAAALCPVHGTRLSETNLPLKGHAQEHKFCMPHEASLSKVKSAEVGPYGVHLSRLATRAVEGELPTSTDWHGAYRQRARSLGYVLPSGDIASGLLSRSVEQAFGAGLLEETACPLGSTPGKAWPARLARHSCDDPLSTAKHVFMNVFLDAGIAAPQDVQKAYKAPGKVPQDYAAVDNQVTRKIAEALRKVAAKRERVTVAWLLEQAGASAAFKHHFAEMPRTKAVLAEFRTSELSERQVGRRLERRRSHQERARAAAVYRERVKQLVKVQP